jgi:hypothetical protein
VFTWNLLQLEIVKWQGKEALAPGKHTLEFDWKYAKPGLGQSGTGTLKVDEQVVDTQPIPGCLSMRSAAPAANCAPSDAHSVKPSVDLMIFLHNVQGLESGLCFFLEQGTQGRGVLNSDGDLLWEAVEEDFPLFLLRKGGFRQDAYVISCESFRQKGIKVPCASYGVSDAACSPNRPDSL